MPLTLYSRYMFYPGGGLVANAAMPVRLMGGNVLAPVFDDDAGTNELANPVETDSGGLLSFYAPPGIYQVSFAGEIQHIPVDGSDTNPVFPGLFVHSQTTPDLVWTVAHRFGVEPRVDVLVDGAAVRAEVAHPDSNTTTITFGAPTAGVAHLRR